MMVFKHSVLKFVTNCYVENGFHVADDMPRNHVNQMNQHEILSVKGFKLSSASSSCSSSRHTCSSTRSSTANHKHSGECTIIYSHIDIGQQKGCLFPLTSPKNIGTVCRQNFLFSLTFFTVQPLVNNKCENTASTVNTSSTYSRGM